MSIAKGMVANAVGGKTTVKVATHQNVSPKSEVSPLQETPSLVIALWREYNAHDHSAPTAPPKRSSFKSPIAAPGHRSTSATMGSPMNLAIVYYSLNSRALKVGFSVP